METFRGVLVYIMTSLPALCAGQDILVGSWGTHSVRRHDGFTGEYLGDFVSPGTAGLSTPDGLGWGPDGNLYVSSSDTSNVLRFDGQTGEFIDVFAAQPIAAAGNLAFGPDGRLYVCSKGNNRVLRFNEFTGEFIDIFAIGGGMTQPVGLAWKDDVLYVSSFNSGAIFRYDAITGGFIGSFSALLQTPLVSRFDAQGNFLVSTHNQNGLRRFTPDGEFLGQIVQPGMMVCPVGHIIGPDGSLIIASWGNNRILRFDAETGQFVDVFAIGFGLLLPNDLLLMPLASESDFVRGDCDGDNNLKLGDPLSLLNYLFIPGSPAPACDDACDGNDNGLLELQDALGVLENLFVPGSPPIPPPTDCGADPTDPDGLGCADYPCP